MLQGFVGVGILVATAAAATPPSAQSPTPAADATPVFIVSRLPEGIRFQDPAPPPRTQAPAATSNVFNPDISVIGNFLGIAGKNPNSEEPSLSLTEAELALQAVVDAYARADFFFAASEDGVEVEEGYITFTALPAHLLLKVGKLRAQFGKVNTLHTHSLPTADRPLVTTNLLGGEEGISDAGFSLSHLVQIPALFVELTGEVFRGDSEVFQTTTRSDLTYGGRVRAYRDLTEATNIDVGFSYAQGPSTIADESIRQAAHRHRRDVPLPAAARRDLSTPEPPHRAHLEPAGSAARPARVELRLLWPRRVSVRASLVHRRAG